jgi:FtsP/CotA-like multicopper oxidase with cupredoxin domain
LHPLEKGDFDMCGKKISRRDFVRSTAVTAGSFGLSGLTVFTPRRAFAATADFNLTAEAIQKTLVDGTELPVWQYRALNAVGPGRLGAGFVVRQGEPVNISLYNDLELEVNLVISGVLEDTAPIAPGSSNTYSFMAPAAGTYLFLDGANGDLGRAMGLAGPMVVIPAGDGNRLFEGGPEFDRQYTLVLNETDDRINRAVAINEAVDLAYYEPNFFFVNGLSYPNTSTDEKTLISMNVGDRVALRFINAGLITNPMHFHGYHVEVVSRNRRLEAAVVEKDTVPVGVDECVDVILTCNQAGAYPLHTHYVPGVTANGVYVNPYGGALIVMNAV